MEYTLFETPKCHVFKLPPKKSAAGYKAEEWEGCNIWTGCCKVLSTENDQCVVRLEDEAGKLFAECPISADPNGPKSIEPVTDSSRYYVLRVENKQTKQHAFLGIGFDERSQAFDFNVSLTDFKKSVQQAKERLTQQHVAKQYDDLSLKSGEKITVNLGGKVKSGEKVNSSATVAAGLGKVGGLAPPPGSKAKGISPPPSSSPRATGAPTTQPVPEIDFFSNSATTFPPTAASTTDTTGHSKASAPPIPDDFFSSHAPATSFAPTPQPTATPQPPSTMSMDDLFKF